LIDTGTTTRPGTIVTGCAPTELHEGGILLLSIFLRRRGWKVVYLGQAVAASDLPQALADMQADVLVLSATLPGSARELKNIQSQLKKIDRKQRPVFAYGGAAFNEFPDLCGKIEGTFLGETIQLAVEAIERLMADQKLVVK
ncbi:MAG TPA: cobalamin B12-binding domain-containing protein, partial [Anaerolineae bacterium]|nr:cobalamin B12-binding domain-containing protein [Anaerolineae bacterium]